MNDRGVWNGRSGYAGKRHPLRNTLLLLLAAAVLFFAALEIYIGVHSRTQVTGEPQVMVIFGCKVEPWGPSVLLQDRLDTALTYLEDHPDTRVVVTGGQGNDEHVTEAQAMYDYLTAHGVDGENVYLEPESSNTWENVNYTRKLIEENTEAIAPEGEVLVVSNGFHLARIKLLWGRVWAGTPLAQVSTLAAPVSHRPSAFQMFFREPLALVKSFVFDRT